ncbi:hypothetical protein HDU93_006093, partial [Gonapodya sp. JEL0774]
DHLLTQKTSLASQISHLTAQNVAGEEKLAEATNHLTTLRAESKSLKKAIFAYQMVAKVPGVGAMGRGNGAGGAAEYWVGYERRGRLGGKREAC